MSNNTHPRVLISSRDGATVPWVSGAAALVGAAEAHGWVAKQTYALAEVPERPRKPAHRLHSVAVTLARTPSVHPCGPWSQPCVGHRGWATWHRETDWLGDDGPWRFHQAWLDGDRYGYRELRAVVIAVGTP